MLVCSIISCAPVAQVLHLQAPLPTVLMRHRCDTSTDVTTDGERRLVSKLQETFPKAEIRVHDISGYST